MAILSILVALLAGTLDAMLWREAQRRAEQAQFDQIEADLAAEREALEQADFAPDANPRGTWCANGLK